MANHFCPAAADDDPTPGLSPRARRPHLPDPELDAQFYDGVPVKRLLAWVLDVLIVAALVLGALIASVGLLAFLFPILTLGLNLGYRIWAVNRWSATLGMRALGIELRNSRGDRLTLSESVAHSTIYAIAFMTLIGAVVNVVMILVTDRGQGLHDMILGTTAINSPVDPV